MSETGKHSWGDGETNWENWQVSETGKPMPLTEAQWRTLAFIDRHGDCQGRSWQARNALQRKGLIDRINYKPRILDERMTFPPRTRRYSLTESGRALLSTLTDVKDEG